MSARPRLGFLGVGWIGRHRMKAMLGTGLVEAAFIADASPEAAEAAREVAPKAEIVAGFDEMLDLAPDGIVIATPSAMHAEQSIRALERKVAVFCQKPLGRTATEVRAVVEAARRADRLLAVDLSYRYTTGMNLIRDAVRAGELGRVFAADLVFHNAYGPDKPWFYDPALSGGGCVMDLGIHLVDLALWALDFPRVLDVSSTLLAGGQPLAARTNVVEDYAVATLELESGAVIRIACSWRLQAGCDAVISADLHGTEGGASFRNVGGSFYDFRAERFRGTARETLTDPPDEWGGRAAADWARRLAEGARFDGSAERLLESALVLDAIYGRVPITSAAPEAR
ncbi:Gfo/Idh/MocA family protein [uncultured Enterovirga sp.]|uniref:Gfo/Idh/MocA family protein n=1 Tax=uncultured Enterovirga sp. TaxID=2026352 RepID=UPI0035C9E8BC